MCMNSVWWGPINKPLMGENSMENVTNNVRIINEKRIELPQVLDTRIEFQVKVQKYKESLFVSVCAPVCVFVL